jgi:hypothetical protein
VTRFYLTAALRDWPVGLVFALMCIVLWLLAGETPQ